MASVPAPAGLDKTTAKLWRDTQRALRGQATWQDTDAPLLEAYVRSVATARRCRADAEAEPYVTGSKGQMVPHPGVRMAAEAERDAAKLAEALLLTPQARRRHDIRPARTGDGSLLGAI